MIEKFVKLINYLKSVPGVSDVDFSIKDPMTIEFKHTSQEFKPNSFQDCSASTRWTKNWRVRHEIAAPKQSHWDDSLQIGLHHET